MSWLQSAMQGEVPGVTLTVIVLVLAVALVALFWIFRKIAGANHVKASRGHRPRLSVTDAAVVDDKRRLVLVRRDNVEHLVMIGGPTDIVVEQNIAIAHLRPVENAEPEDWTGQAEIEHAEEEEPDHPAQPEPVEPERERPALESRPAARTVPPRPDIGPAADRPAFARPPLAPPGRPAEPTSQREPERQMARQAVQPERQPGGPSRPQPFVANEAPDNGALFDEQFTSDLEAAFNEERAATPAVTAETRHGAARHPVSADIAPPARKRSENMEEEMQRLLDELSGSKPN